MTQNICVAQTAQGSSNTSDDRDGSEDSGSEEEYAPISETDAERRETLLASEDSKDISNLGNKLGSRDAWKQFEKDFNFGNVKLESSQAGPSASTSIGDAKRGVKADTVSSSSTSGRTTRITTLDVIDISSDEEDTSRPSGQRCDVQAPSGSTGTIAGARSSREENPAASQSKSSSTSTSIPSFTMPSKKAPGKQKDAGTSSIASHPAKVDSSKVSKEAATNPSTTSNWGVSNSTSGRGRQELGLGSLVKTEVEFRKKEALGLAGRKNAGGRTLGSRPSELHSTPGSSSKPRPPSGLLSKSASNNNSPLPFSQGGNHKWTCLVCTL